LETEADGSGSAVRAVGAPVCRSIRTRRQTPAEEGEEQAARAESRAEERYAASGRLGTFNEMTGPRSGETTFYRV
jgi:hypothetical protein